ncbi:MAG: isopentenyl-diphosphate delta-isomerase [Thaumarchaeota archaeon 13_1_40CM_38_12]|nr:MAG: isopentenyl-diphosphate delta-isomerase [Thaumarchaeota archaeon 13_1_40CM_38_12]OLE40288.1 MAG: isopentenyl-diphosphate delta-isomerase [Thaumarchaeota archaeon 13_1_20CM_2_38_5]
MENLILVDRDDNQTGIEEKVKCHLPDGKLHRAFTILLFNKDGQLLLTQRSMSKMLWPGDWDGTVASHPRQSETYVSSAERRLPEELGITCKLDYLFKFEYHVTYKNLGSENEICGTLIGIIEDPKKIKIVKDEISSIRWVNLDELLAEIKKSPKIFCPWMLVALYFLPESNENINEKHREILKIWNRINFKTNLEEPLKYHFPDHRWELKRE